MKRLGITGLVVAILAGSLAGRASMAQQSPLAVPDQVFIKLRGIDGKSYDVTGARGRVTVVSFGATWCAPCHEELRALAELKQEYSGQPVDFYWVSVERDNEISNKELREFARRLKITFPVLRDPTKLTYAQFSTRQRVPLIAFFDRDGKFAAPLQFGMSEAEAYKKKMRARLNQMLGVNN